MIYEKTFRRRLSSLVDDGGSFNFEQKTGVNAKILDQFLSGSVLPTLQTLEQIATATGVSIGWLIGEEQHPQSPVHIKEGVINNSMVDLAQWISEQEDGINYWEVLKSKLALENPEFREWLKKRKG